MTTRKTIQPQDLVCMNEFASMHHYRVDLAYAQDDNLLFGERIYREDAKLWLHVSLAKIVKKSATYCFENHKLRFILYDGLRTTDAQEAMMKTQRALDNPHWLEKARLLSPPGAGGHPRGMAIDIGLETLDGELIDMGTAFDYLSEDPEKNPAHRAFPHNQDVIDNRKILDDSMKQAATSLNMPLLLLPEEWWDFRLPPDIYEQYEPLSENDLPAHMRLTIQK
ncbi:MAG: D-Ala-D-Ala dipeptidase [Alphaproteobacteria bacterium]|nr:MAG: D-Ala-D-Ala dipeptidase [Alphaproteobacteria bacterium]